MRKCTREFIQQDTVINMWSSAQCDDVPVHGREAGVSR